MARQRYVARLAGLTLYAPYVHRGSPRLATQQATLIGLIGLRLPQRYPFVFCWMQTGTVDLRSD